MEKGENEDWKKEGRKECTEESHREVRKFLRVEEKCRAGWGRDLGRSGHRSSIGEGNVREGYGSKNTGKNREKYSMR